MNHLSIVEDHPAIVPDRQCQHGFRLRSCGIRECVALRESMFVRATREGRRDTSEPWPNSFGETHIAIDLTEPTRDYHKPMPVDERSDIWKGFAITVFAALVLGLAGLALSSLHVQGWVVATVWGSVALMVTAFVVSASWKKSR